MDENNHCETDVIVAESKIRGIGVFAARDFAESEIVLEIDDSRIVDEEHPLLAEAGEYEYHRDYLADGKVVLMKSPERHINSCCDPNAFVRTIDGVRHVVTRRSIKADDEITRDYILLLENKRIKLIVFDLESEVISKWIQ